MNYLIAITALWAFSFSFIGEFLAGKVDSYFAILVRVALASLIFVPFTRFRGLDKILMLKIMGIGIVQIGLMYMFFYNSFLYISVPEVVLFTIFTPIHVTLIYDAFKGKFRSLYLLSASIAVLGAFIIRYQGINEGFLKGFLMVQAANFCFALGQTYYKKVLEDYKGINQREVFGYFHFGALIIAVIAFALFGNMTKITPDATQWAVLLWLGIVASGAGYFMWNKGATMVDAGVLAIMNNALVPAGLIVNLVIWQKPTNYLLLTIGSAVIIFSLWLHERFRKRYALA